MAPQEAEAIYLYYFMEKGGVQGGAMTLPTFVRFLLEDVATDDAYAAMLDQNTQAQVAMLATYTDVERMTTPLSASEIAALLGMAPEQAQMLFAYCWAQSEDYTPPARTLAELMAVFQSGALPIDLITESLDLTSLDMSMFAQGGAALPSGALEYGDAASLFGVDAGMVKLVYTLYDAAHGGAAEWRLSAQAVLHFLTDNGAALGGMLNAETAAALQMARGLVDAAVAGVAFTPAELAEVLPMDEAQLTGLYLLYTSEHGDTSKWTITPQVFLDFLATDVLADETMAANLDASMANSLRTVRTLVDAVLSGKVYSEGELATLLGGLGGALDADTLSLLYLYHFSAVNGDSGWTLSLPALVGYLNGTLMQDARFDGFLDDTLRADIAGMQAGLEDGESQLRGPQHARLILSTTYPGESEETTAFFDRLTQWADQNLKGSYYLVGNAAMNYEMAKTFDREMSTITLLTAIAIFVVVLLTFRSLVIPVILVLIIQCGVFMTVSIIGLQGYSVYYLALLIVQCILMGATIDYGILFSSYYVEKRKTMLLEPALTAAYNGSIHTILTSSLIMIIITGILGYCFENPIIGQICQTISMGALCATLLIVFVLPGLLAAFDRLIYRKAFRQEEKKDS